MKQVYRILILLIALLSLGSIGLAQQGRLPFPVSDALYARAAQMGKIPVIVRLDTPYTWESRLTTREARQQRARLTTLRQDMLADFNPRQIILNGRSDRWMIPYMALWVNEKGLRALEATPGIISIVEDVPDFPSLNSSAGVLDVYEAYNLGYTGLDQTVALLDSGVDKNHPLLSERVIGEICYSTNFSSVGLSSLCPNAQDIQSGAGAAAPTKCAGIDQCSHGTFMGGIVAGAPFTVGVNTYAGIGYGAKILAAQVYTRSTTDFGCGIRPTPCIAAFTTDQVEALQKIYDTRGSYNLAAVVFGYNGSVLDGVFECLDDPRVAIFGTFYDVGIPVIVPSGNNSDTDQLAAPACVPDAISVGATDDGRVIPSFSNSSILIDLLAPGVDVQSAVGVIEIAEEDGTSAAAAHVAGAWAVLKQARPNAPVSMVLDALQTSGIGVIDGRNGVNKPFIQVGEALKLIRAVPAEANLILNPGFEDGVPVANWTTKGSGGKRYCSIAGDPLVRTGVCSAQLKSNGATNSVTQVINFTAASGDFVWFGAYVNTHAAKGTITATLDGADGHKIILKLDVLKTGTYRLLSNSGALRAQNYTATIKLTINKTGGGSYEADDLILTVQNGGDTLR